MTTSSAPATAPRAQVAAIALGGALGALSRHAVGGAFPVDPAGWPVATTLVNLSGCFALGLLLEALGRRGTDAGRRRLVRLGAGTGFLGSFTTYSALAVEVDLLAAQRAWPLVVAYPVVSVLAGVALCASGAALAQRVVRRGDS